ncbi:Ubiquitin-conjugating enzyme E2 D2 [Exophiala xenobiotica]|uniref:Ubiquitin-conjugating enzyme E2 D2 n=1 Tax=Vermiconidia calcicola TaxID=1690605 RepID=A0AAV9PQ08_9PEZI|nr:Ubiquitin-conjugating enzyme E2 D2 [Exophiala xenobiotica]KAK5425411.1 Ubiquitin-conjugating enzyme E2 D2 [Exophiala xenobiotica]KAK5527478.1 Ubiquitin-conjugating enzyme E2 D2 [Vermiconidia calcicola]KAK5550609.1 Ubiquitin-conjugating enzyme E2 1 [Exophiala xenobiotica]
MLPSQSYNPFAHRAFDDLSINESFVTTETHRIEAESIRDQAADASSTHGSFNTALTQQSTDRLGLDRNEHESNSSWVGGSPQTRHLVAQQLITQSYSQPPPSNEGFSSQEKVAQRAKFLSIKERDASISPPRHPRTVGYDMRNNFRDATSMTSWPIYDNPWDLLCTFLGPDDTPSEGGIFFTRLAIPEEFPYKPPIVKFLTRVYHPNIDARGRVCADILGSMYSPALGLYRSLISVISILDDPNVDDPLVPENRSAI